MTRRRVVLASGVCGAVVLVVALGVFLTLGTGFGTGRDRAVIQSYALQADGRTLSVQYLAGDPSCEEPGGVTVGSQTASEIRLDARIRNLRKGRVQVCTLVGRIVTAEVTLDEPLAARPVVDDSTGTVLPTAPPPAR